VAPEPNVRVFNDFVPGDSRLTELLGQTSVFALPSDTDMSPYSVLEAMACGIPVVACRVGAVPEMVEDGVTGLLVEPGDDEGLGAALATLLRDAHLRHQMGEAAKARFSRCFDAAVTTEALVEVLKEATVTFVARGRVANRTADATRARTCACTPPPTWPVSPPNSTLDPARSSAGRPPPSSSIDSSCQSHSRPCCDDRRNPPTFSWPWADSHMR
jgi:hypothetical protein